MLTVLRKSKANWNSWKSCASSLPLSPFPRSVCIVDCSRPVLRPVEKELEVHFRFPDPEPLNGTIMQLDDVTFTYSKSSPVILNNINLSANLSSRICIVGENGSGNLLPWPRRIAGRGYFFSRSGKTTLLKLLVEELEPTRGQRHGHRNLAIGYFTQHFVDQLPMNVNCVEVLQMRFPGMIISIRWYIKMTRIFCLGKPIEQYRTELGRFGLTGDTPLQSVMSLSGGQKCRLAFSLMCMKKWGVD